MAVTGLAYLLGRLIVDSLIAPLLKKKNTLWCVWDGVGVMCMRACVRVCVFFFFFFFFFFFLAFPFLSTRHGNYKLESCFLTFSNIF